MNYKWMSHRNLLIATKDSGPIRLQPHVGCIGYCCFFFIFLAMRLIDAMKAYCCPLQAVKRNFDEPLLCERFNFLSMITF